jgi:hypothetical protein
MHQFRERSMMMIGRRIAFSASLVTVRRLSRVGDNFTPIVSQVAAEGRVVEGLISQMGNEIQKVQVVTSVVSYIYQQQRDCDRELRAAKAARDKALSHFQIK